MRPAARPSRRHCRALIKATPLVFVATSDPNGRYDVSPRGGPPGWVRMLDRAGRPARGAGQPRLDSLGNVLGSGWAALYRGPGAQRALRVQGPATVTRIGNCWPRSRSPAGFLRGPGRRGRRGLHPLRLAFVRSGAWDPTAGPTAKMCPLPPRDAGARRERVDHRKDGRPNRRELHPTHVVGAPRRLHPVQDAPLLELGFLWPPARCVDEAGRLCRRYSRCVAGWDDVRRMRSICPGPQAVLAWSRVMAGARRAVRLGRPLRPADLDTLGDGLRPGRSSEPGRASRGQGGLAGRRSRGVFHDAALRWLCGLARAGWT